MVNSRIESERRDDLATVANDILAYCSANERVPAAVARAWAQRVTDLSMRRVCEVKNLKSRIAGQRTAIRCKEIEIERLRKKIDNVKNGVSE